MAQNTANNLLEALEKAGGSPELIETVKRDASDRILIDHLMSLRGARGFSQEDIAKHFGCTQSKISKLENGIDADLRIGDLISYCEAIGLELSVGMSPKGLTAIDRIKQHAFCIQAELDDMVGQVGADEAIAQGVAAAHVEVLMNLMKLVAASAEKLPSHPENDAPRIQIEAHCKVVSAKPAAAAGGAASATEKPDDCSSTLV